MVTLVTTLLISQKQFVGPSMGMPIMRNLYRNASFISTAILSAAKYAGFDSVLTFGMPRDRGTVKKYNDTCHGASGCMASTMSCVKK